MLHHLGAGKAVWSEWHERREEARRTAHSTAEFSDIEIEKYDLDTAGITGKDNPETYRGEDSLRTERRPHDMREQEWTGGY